MPGNPPHHVVSPRVRHSGSSCRPWVADVAESSSPQQPGDHLAWRSRGKPRRDVGDSGSAQVSQFVRLARGIHTRVEHLEGPSCQEIAKDDAQTLQTQWLLGFVVTQVASVSG